MLEEIKLIFDDFFKNNTEKSLTNFFSNSFETSRDGVIEFYEFVDFSNILRYLHKDKRTIKDVKIIMNDIRKGVFDESLLDRLWEWDENGNCSDINVYNEWKREFKVIDKDGNGVIDLKEFLDYYLCKDKDS